MSFLEKCSSTVESLQAMLVEYSFGKYELALLISYLMHCLHQQG